MAMTATPAMAHTRLTGSDPKKNSSVASPQQIELTYTDSIRLPRVILSDESGRQRQTGKAEAVDNKVTLPISGTLANGKYTVGWRVVSADGHPVTGSYSFTVEGSSGGAGTSTAPSAQPAAPAPAPSPSNASATEESDGGSSGWLWIGLIALIGAAAAGAVAWLRRSRTSQG
ncbi:copper resistance protein CopC [Actinomadura spongiicola]|uniref:Copper resistance protein CopC n=1 Tax=Actinomadura spongiicola TaxID=2303421 RepID=A0A372GR19_9ACTN|nr:copper resistance protein CopC [Actinomadura spongiicola]